MQQTHSPEQAVAITIQLASLLCWDLMAFNQELRNLIAYIDIVRQNSQ